MKEFQKGQRIETASGSELEVLDKLGEGGQGIVYRVNYNGRQLALKWYFGNKLSNADKFYRNIQNNINAIQIPQKLTYILNVNLKLLLK